jgi:hypothetical protein
MTSEKEESEIARDSQKPDLSTDSSAKLRPTAMKNRKHQTNISTNVALRTDL